MELIQQSDMGRAARPSQRTRAVILAGPGLAWLADVVRGQGVPVEEVAECYDALAAVADDPAGYSLVVQSCEGAEGLEWGQKSASLLWSIAPGVAVLLLVSAVPTEVTAADVQRKRAEILGQQDARQVAGHVLARARHGRGASRGYTR